MENRIITKNSELENQTAEIVLTPKAQEEFRLRQEAKFYQAAVYGLPGLGIIGGLALLAHCYFQFSH
jgi:hypothetical protein